MTPSVQHTFAVQGMHCTSCTLLIDDTLEDLEGVLSAATSLRQGITVVELDPNVCTPDVVGAAIAELGYHSSPYRAVTDEGTGVSGRPPIFAARVV